MKELFERHQDRLRPDEARRVWQAMHDARSGASRRRWVWTLAPTAAAAALAVLVFGPGLWQNRGPDLRSDAEPAARGAAPAPLAGGETMADAEPIAENEVFRKQASAVDGAAPAENAVPALLADESAGNAGSMERAETRDGAAAADGDAVRLRVAGADGKALALAGAIVSSSGAYFTAELDGILTIPGDAIGANDTLLVEYFGYETKRIPAADLSRGDVAVRLELVDESLFAQMEEETQFDAFAPPETSAPTGRADRGQAAGAGSAVADGSSKAKDESWSLSRMAEPAPQARAERDAPSAAAGNEVRALAPSTPAEAKEGTARYYAGAPGAKKGDPGRWPISVGGTDPVNGEAYDSMFFRNYGVNPFVDPRDDRFATFAVDVDNASYSLARSYLLDGNLPPAEAIRVEEFVNAFRANYPAPGSSLAASRVAPSEHGTFAIHLDAAPSPFHAETLLLRVGLKGKEVDPENRKPAVLTFVIDVSGSMAREDRLELVKRSLRLLLDRMRPSDEVALVVYGSTARVVLPHTSLEDGREIERAIDALVPEGATNAEAGLLEGYRLAERAFQKGCINRVILCSDGVANVGNTGADSILERIQREARRGIELSAIGFGMGNYNDVLMEQLANHGDGNYYYVDDIAEARRVFVENLTGTLQTIAKEVKIQVEFDPAVVRSYRLLGYENRDVRDEDFRNDLVDAGEVGAGHEVTALFEVKTEASARRGDLATVRIRYEHPETGVVTEEARDLPLDAVAASWRQPDPGFRVAAAAAQFAEILRGSYWAKDDSLAPVLNLARQAERELRGRDDARELTDLVRRAARLMPEERRLRWGAEEEDR